MPDRSTATRNRAPSVTAKGVRGIIAYAQARGLKRDDLLARASLPPELLQDPDGRVSQPQMLSIWENVAAGLDDPTVACSVARSLPFGAYDVLDYAFATSPTVRHAVGVVTRYIRLFLDDAEVQVEEGPDCVVVRYALRSNAQLERYSAEFAFGLLIDRLDHSVAVDGWSPLWVAFSHEAAAPAENYEAVFRSPVSFGAAANRIAFSHAFFDAHMRRKDPTLHSVLQRHAATLLDALPRTSGTDVMVRRELYDMLDEGRASPTIEDVGARLGLGARTLQRRLAEDDTTFATLLDEIRYELATRFLADETVTIGEVGFLLGFSEPSAFHRAFRRWSGMTPGEYRRSFGP